MTRFLNKLFNNLINKEINYLAQKLDIKSIRPVDLGICFNMLDHTNDALRWFDLFVEKIKPGGSFWIQVNTVWDGLDQIDDHKTKYPPSIIYEEIVKMNSDISNNFGQVLSINPLRRQ